MANHQNRSKRNASRWTDAKLDKEIAFAMSANDGSAECVAWLEMLQAEAARRHKFTLKPAAGVKLGVEGAIESSRRFDAQRKDYAAARAVAEAPTFKR